jgi:adenosylcobinamide kinase / adenosylcobinamide-phosphate guanylyltransferase
MSVSSSPHLTLLLGGVRSGKSAKAVALAAELQGAGRVLFVATAEALDAEMAARIHAHRGERPPTWDTLESPLHIAADLERTIAERSAPYAVIVIDCMTVWVSNILLSLADDEQTDNALSTPVEDLLDLRRRTHAATHWIVVSNEVGLGVVPSTALGRRYRDVLGRANQLVAAAADDVTLMVSGLELALKRTPSRISTR